MDFSLLSDQEQRELIEQAEQIRRARLQLARVDYNEFAEYVLRDEQTGQPLRQAWLHEMWTEVRRQHQKALIIAHVEAGKTQQFSLGVPLHELGLNPRGRYAVISRTWNQSLKIIRSAAKYIESSDALHEVFPDLVPGARWSDTGLFVKREGVINEPSLQALGYQGAISGARLDGVILDDFLDSTNTRTKARRDDTEAWFFSEVVSRLTDDAWVFFIGNAWHPDDLYQRLERQGWPTYRFPVLVTPDLVKRHPLVTVPAKDGGFGLSMGSPSWPERWSLKRIEERRALVPPIEFARSMMCEARDDSDARFKREWLETALQKGADLPPCHTTADFLRWDDPDYAEDEEMAAEQVRRALDGDDNTAFWIVSGVDLSTGKADDLSAISTIAVDRVNGKRFLLSIESGRWQVDEIISRIRNAHARYGSIFIVENNATQDFIVQILQRQTAIPVVPYTTGRSKSDPTTGVEVLAAEMAAGKWVIPSKNGEGATEDIAEVVTDMLFFSPDPRAHTGDRLMSLWFAQVLASRLERRAARRGNDEGVLII